MGVGWLCLVCGERLERLTLQKRTHRDFKSFPLL
jgi:hypothetical protein